MIRDSIADKGWLVQGVEGNGLYPPWAYTIGLSDFGMPELVVTGLPLREAAALLNRMAVHALHSSPLEPGDRIPLPDGLLLEVVRLAEPSAHLVFAVALFGPEIRALQLVFADERGRWPWAPDFRDGRGGQPVLGLRRPPTTP